MPLAVVEIHIQVPDVLLKVRGKRRALVVERLVDAELPLEPRDLLGRACERDHARALDFAELAHGGAYRARRARDDERLAGLELSNVEQTLGRVGAA